MEKFKDARISAMEDEIKKLQRIVRWYDDLYEYVQQFHPNILDEAEEHASTCSNRFIENN